MAGMILMSGLSNLSNSLSKQNLPPRGAYAPGYGQQQGGGGMEEMLPNMLRMQQMQAQMQNQQQDNELQRKQFEAGQQTAAQAAAAEQQRAEAVERAIPLLAEKTGQPQEIVRAALRGLGKDNPLLKALSSQFEDFTLGAGQGRFGQGGAIRAAMPEKTEFGSYLLGEHSIDSNVVGAKKSVAVAGRPDQRQQIYMPPDETEQGKVIGKAAGDRWVGVYDQEASAKNTLDKWQAIESLTKDIPTGQGFDSWRTEFMKVLAGAGVNINEQELADRQGVDKIVSKLAFEAMNNKATDAGANPTDRDLLQMIMQQPGIETTNAGRKLMVDLQTAEYDWARGKRVSLEKMRKEMGRRMLPEEVFEFESQYAASVPKYGKVAEKWGSLKPQTPQPNPNAGGATPPPVPQPDPNNPLGLRF